GRNTTGSATCRPLNTGSVWFWSVRCGRGVGAEAQKATSRPRFDASSCWIPKLHCWMRGVFRFGSMVNCDGGPMVWEVFWKIWSTTEYVPLRMYFTDTGALRAKSNHGSAFIGE